MKTSIICLFVLTIACNNAGEKGLSPIILKDGSFVFIQLSVRFLSDGVHTDISFTNTSNSPVLFYKHLLPINERLETNVFAIFNKTKFDEVYWKGIRHGQYLKTAPDDEDGVIIPVLSPDHFTSIQPMQTLSFDVNLSNFYDFSPVKKGDSLFMVYSAFLPAVSKDFKQIFETDSLDGKIKPVYYLISLLAEHKEIDSMRVHFQMPGK